jgi:AraC family transcriptional regulator, ethanolamine operon transcriptional activator
LAAPPFHSELVRQQYALFEEFSEAVQGWDLDFCQLGKADAPFYLQQLAGSRVSISRAYLSPGFYQMGGATPGCRTVSVLVSRGGDGAWRWCGERVTQNSLLVMPVGGEFESISAPNLDSIHLAIPIPLLERVAQTQFALPLHQLMPDGRCFCPEGGQHLLVLRNLLQRLTLAPGAEYDDSQVWLTPQLEEEMAHLVLSCLAGSKAEMPRGPRSKRMKCLARAMEVLTSAEADQIEVAQLVTEVGVSRRTLENAFRDGLGVGPANFLKSRRLHRLNRSLLHADHSSTAVALLARQHGFHHQGQLAADYRALFGESPSITLRRPA